MLVPGQVVTREIVKFLMALDVQEIHGYEPSFGLRVFTDEALAIQVEKINGRERTSLLEAADRA